MFLNSRKHGSQRAADPIRLQFLPNFTGSGGANHITLFQGPNLGAPEKYYWLKPESEEEVKEFLSQVHILHHNFR